MCVGYLHASGTLKMEAIKMLTHESDEQLNRHSMRERWVEVICRSHN